MIKVLLKSAVFAAAVTSASVNADTISVLFSGSSATAEYTFNTTFDGTSGSWSSSLDAATLTYGGNTFTYDAAINPMYTLGGDGFTSFYILNEGVALPVFGPPGTPAAADTISSLTFDGGFGLDSNTGYVSIFYAGDQTTYTGANFSFIGDLNYWGDGSLARDSFFTGTSFDTVAVTTVSAVPVPAAAWLFISGVIGLVGVSRRKLPKAA